MKALFAEAATVPWGRIARDHRAWLLPLGLVLGINAVVLVAVLLPLSRAVEAGDRRAAVSAEARAAAAADLKQAEATRDGQAQADKDLAMFYKDVLPADVAAARRITHLKLSQLAREHDVTFERSAAMPETVRDSALERLKVTYQLSGDYADIRQFIFEIETGQDFLIIDNVALTEGSDPTAPLALTLDLSTYFRTAAHE